ncbi:hypothetical protein GCM10009839_78940 [Catenulispora yoronensis]|uniref:DUF1453 domain-containing protein n=1 Tax=Catenulispora yoronensis TaxID=450799 RepID=A0ABP5H1R6_9ACTN
MDASVWIVNLVVLGAVLLSDLGYREVSILRLVRPVAVAAVIVPLFVKHPQTEGAGLLAEVGGAVVGVLLGLGAAALMEFDDDRRTGKVHSRAGYGYAALWTGVIAARLTFAYGAQHWFPAQIGGWMVRHRVTVDGLTDALLLMAVAMLLGRTGAMASRRLRLIRERIGAWDL